MLGLADRSRSFLLFEMAMAGEVSEALKILDQLYREGSEPLSILEDLMDITHWLTRIKVVPSAIQAAEVPEVEQVKGLDLESQLTMATLARCWQMLLKGLGEVRIAPSPIQAAEMIIVRLAYTAELPTPEEAIRKIDSSGNDAISLIESDKNSALLSERPIQAASIPLSVKVDSTPDLTSYKMSEIDKKGAEKHPLVQAVMETFPGSTIEEVRAVSTPPIQLDPETDPNCD